MQSVLVVTYRYLPGYKGGGPIRSVSNLVSSLQQKMFFRVVTCDRDAGDLGPYPGVVSGQRHYVGGAEVLYLAPSQLSFPTLLRISRAYPDHVLYLNGLFNPPTVAMLLMRRLGLLPQATTVLAPRGELSRGALSLGRVKKTCWLFVSNFLALYRGLRFHATSAEECTEIRSALRFRGEVHLAPNIVDLQKSGPPPRSPFSPYHYK